jgi:hypothetical protein
MNREIVQKKLTVNCLSDDMIRCAQEKGYKMPCVSIAQHYRKSAIFVINYKENIISNFELIIYGNKGKMDTMYLMPT